MRQLPLAQGVLTLLSALHAQAQAEAGAPVPRHRDALEAFQAKQAKSGGPPLSPADGAVMEQAATILAAAMPEPGLKVGETAPDFELPNANGREVRLSDLLTQGPVALVFYRGAWCPNRNLHLHALHEALPLIQPRGPGWWRSPPRGPTSPEAMVSASRRWIPTTGIWCDS